MFCEVMIVRVVVGWRRGDVVDSVIVDGCVC